MPAAARIRPLDLFPREEWERLSARNAWTGPLLVVHAWVIIAAAMALSVWSPWFLPVSVMLIGARQLGLTILMHDAAHGALLALGLDPLQREALPARELDRQLLTPQRHRRRLL